MMDLKETILKFADDMQENMVACAVICTPIRSRAGRSSARRPR